MQLVNANEVEALKGKDYIIKTLFSDKKVDFGNVVIPRGVKIPREGFGSHDADEYSIVIRGSIKVMSGGKEYQLNAGQASLIPAGEEHWCSNEGSEDCEIVWVMVK
ncbi:cupin domain-containing protein [Desulfofalx alkaliphila]|uniref:cupin domain-containing protein n=1 Tax=Desulfofalx alkaliphila TaxID=105483 RepID=UPI0004E22012|nr:cupin domain-containing protein [Desulfofalx alkaliphila]